MKKQITNLTFGIGGFFAKGDISKQKNNQEKSQSDQGFSIGVLNKTLQIIDGHNGNLSSTLTERYKQTITATKSAVNRIGTLSVANINKNNPAATFTKNADKILSLDFINKFSINKSIPYMNLDFQF
jgi:hypothetical protein